MGRVAQVAGWLIAANLGVTCLLLGAIAGWTEWWAAPLAIVGVTLGGVAVTGLLFETRRVIRGRSMPWIFRRDARVGPRSAEPRRLTPIRMDLGQGSERQRRREPRRPVRQR